MKPLYRFVKLIEKGSRREWYTLQKQTDHAVGIVSVPAKMLLRTAANTSRILLTSHNGHREGGNHRGC